MLYMCVYMHSHFVENHPIRILEDGPFISEVVLSHTAMDSVARARKDRRRLRCMAMWLRRAMAWATNGAGYQCGRVAAAPLHGDVAPTRGSSGSSCTGRGVERWLYGVFPPLCAKWSAVAPRQRRVAFATPYRFHLPFLADACSIRSHPRWLPVPHCTSFFHHVR
jgi:hypothetical protein